MIRPFKFVFWVAMFFSCVACGSPDATQKEYRGGVCDLIGGVKLIPFRTGEKGFDANYDKLMGDAVSAGEVVECITDVRLMPDPRMMPDKVNEFRIGDAAYIIFIGKQNLEFEQFLPKEVGEKVRREGARNYFDWVNQQGNREALKAAVSEKR